MVREGIGRALKIGEANTRYISIPATVATDDEFPFEDWEYVRVRITKDGISVERIQEG